MDFGEFGLHPAVVLSVNGLDSRLGHVAVVPGTGTRGPDQTHVALEPDAAPSRYPESFADATRLQPMARRRLLRRRGLLAPPGPDRPAGQRTIYLGPGSSPPGATP